ncbi:MAG TPA: threonine--tRNA ligase [Nitrospiraceae bacterium]|nr:threonine--tRNA ligase [Nitrospiraceae bacterium]
MPIGGLRIIRTLEDKEKEVREIYRHSTSHIMAHAVKELYSHVKLAIGPATSDGFYYDFDYNRTFTNEDLMLIEDKMREIIKADRPFIRKEMLKKEASELFRKLGETYKVELLEEIEDDVVSVYEEGGFADLCQGPHIPSTGGVRAFKLLSVAGAYWRGNEHNKMLQRIYGTSFSSEDDLNAYLSFLEEVKKRDHRRLGKDLDLFSINDEIGPGLVLWHPMGAAIRNTIEDFWKEEHYRAGYKILFTPHIARLDIWKKSGHWDFYRENMYSPMEIENLEYEIKPMNCPFHIAIYKTHLHSYKEFPIRYAELGTVYRYERSGVLHGLLRVRGFTQDDAHIFCREDQIEDEILNVLDFTLFILRTFGFKDYDIHLSTRPERFVGIVDNWDRATLALKSALENKKLTYNIDPGEGVFYGPKIDIKVKDCLGRPWQCSTIQVDFNIPEKFDIVYRGADGKEHRPIMIHRALMGSLERFFGILIEHYAGAFPTWLSPVQVSILTIAERHSPYAQKAKELFIKDGIRIDINTENEKIGYKIRETALLKIPYILIIGDKEVENNTVNVRRRGGENLGEMSVEKIKAIISEEIKSRSDFHSIKSEVKANR